MLLKNQGTPLVLPDVAKKQGRTPPVLPNFAKKPERTPHILPDVVGNQNTHHLYNLMML